MERFLSKKTVFGLLLAFVLMMSVGGVLSAEVMMEDGMMHDCPYMGMTAICNMSPLQHLSEWQKMFTATVQQTTTPALLLLLALASVIGYFFRDIFIPKQTQRFVPRSRDRETIFDPLRLAFARGIIHPKVY